MDDPIFHEIPIKTAEDIIFVHDSFSLESIPDSKASIFRLGRKSAQDMSADAVAYKAVAERELRKRVGFILKNEGKALERMREMRRYDRSVEGTRVYFSYIGNDVFKFSCAYAI